MIEKPAINGLVGCTHGYIKCKFLLRNTSVGQQNAQICGRKKRDVAKHLLVLTSKEHLKNNCFGGKETFLSTRAIWTLGSFCIFPFAGFCESRCHELAAA